MMTFKFSPIIIILSFFSLLFLSCGSDEGPSDTPETDCALARQVLAEVIVNNYILDAYTILGTDANTLKESSQTFSNDPSEANLTSLQAALKKIWLSWQDAAMFQMGPTETNALLSTINIYPSDASKIESNINTGDYVLGSIDSQTAQGFPAIDYLINQNDAITALESEERLNYLKALIVHTADAIQQVKSEWEAGTFINDYTSTTANGTDVGSALGLLINSIDLHFQRFVRDGKIAIPAGIRSAGVTRPTAVEAYYGAYSIELLLRSLNAYHNLFKGKGLDGTTNESLLSYLEKLDQKSIADDIDAKFVEVIQKVSELNNPLSAQVDDDADKVEAIFIAMQELVTLFKADMVSVMGITLTNVDNDGD